MSFPRLPFDAVAYEERVRGGPCFVCGVVRGDPAFPHHIVYRDDVAVAFLSQPSPQLGHCLVAPLEHREQAIGDFSLPEYLQVQTVVHRVGRAVSETVPTERLYVLSFGSQQGNSHVHWHVVPLPPGVPYAEQQFNAVNLERAGALDISPDEIAELAGRIAAKIGANTYSGRDGRSATKRPFR